MKRLFIFTLGLLFFGSNLPAQSTILKEGFEVWPPEGWTDYQTNIGYSWGQCFQGNCGHTGDYSAYNYLCNGCEKWLVTPLIHIGSEDTQITFWEKFEENSIQYYNYSGVKISIGSGDPDDGDFVEIFTNGAGNLPANWIDRNIDLSAYNGQDVYIAFHWSGNWHEWFVDDVLIAPPAFIDGAITQFINPIGTYPNPSVEDVIITMFNNGTEIINDLTINWDVNGNSQPPYLAAALNLQPEESIDITLGQFDFATEGDYTITASLALGNDFNTQNDTFENIYFVTSLKDAAITDISPNGYSPIVGATDIKVKITNEGDASINTMEVTWEVEGIDQIPFQVSGLDILPGTSEWITIGQYNFSQGIYKIKANVNASGEINPDNDLFTAYLSVNTFWESFEGTAFPPEGWHANWALKDAGFLFAPHGEFYYVASSDNNFFGEIRDTMFTPFLSIENGDQLTFYRRFSAFSPGNLKVIWENMATGNIIELQTVSTTPDSWEQVVVNLSPAVGVGRIGFASFSSSYGEQAIDLITSDAEVYLGNNDLMVKNFDSHYLARLGNSHNVNFTLKNIGANTVAGDSYTLKLMQSDGTELASINGVDISSYEEVSLQIDHIFLETSEYEIFVQADIADDSNPLNNNTRPTKIYGVPADVELIDVGQPGIPNLNFPFDFGGDTWTFSADDISQSIFYQDEINTGGYIYGITYYYRNVISNYQKLPIKVWIAPTELQDLSNGWDTTDDFTLIVDDTLEVKPGQINTFYIPFETPVFYNNLNNLVLQHYVYNPEWPPAFGGFYATEAQGPERVVRLLNSLEADPDNLPPVYGLHTDYSYTTFVIDPIDQLATISGTAFDENNQIFPNVNVAVTGQLINEDTDVNGNYELPALPYADYTLTATAYGYNDNIQIITADQANIEVDFYMELRPQVQITGNVVGSDVPSVPLEGVEVMAFGYEQYNQTTDASGIVSLENVYGNASYNITFSKYGYYSKTIQVEIADAGIDFGTVELQQEFISPYNVVATQLPTSAGISWQDPITSAKGKNQKDSGNTDFSYTNEPNENVWLGNKFINTESVTLQNVEVYWDIYLLASDFVTIDIFDENEQVIASSLPFTTQRDSLMTIDLPNVRIEGNYYVMVHWQNNAESTHALRVDWSIGLENTAHIKYPGGVMTLMSDFIGDPPGAFFVRTNVLKNGNNSGNSPLSYNIYSGDPNDLNNVSTWPKLNAAPINGTNYEDDSAMNGEIIYAVEAVYEEGVSEPSFSNVLDFFVGNVDILFEKEIHIFPNPTEGNIFVRFDLKDPEQILIEVINGLGQQILASPLMLENQVRWMFDLSNLPAGIYWVKIQIGDKYYISDVVKQ